MSFAATALKKAAAAFGLEISRRRREPATKASAFPVELTAEERELFLHVREHDLTMVSDERLFTTIMACRFVLERGIAGDFVECGVWRGGNALLAAGVFKAHRADRNVYLFDTFAGMTAPTEFDREAAANAAAAAKFESLQREAYNEWCYASLQDVRANFSRAGLLDDRVVFVPGDVVATLDGDVLPERIAVLRLDTDWYESTKKEFEVLYPRLSLGGVLIIDDYGHWAGARKATDEYFAAHGHRPFLQYTDYTGRVGVKLTE
jgi:O-methyltransferase